MNLVSTIISKSHFYLFRKFEDNYLTFRTVETPTSSEKMSEDVADSRAPQSNQVKLSFLLIYSYFNFYSFLMLILYIIMS